MAHANAALTPRMRLRLARAVVEDGWSVSYAAAVFQVAYPTAKRWALRYRKVRRGEFWVQDNASDFYNRYRNKRQGGFRWWLPTSDANSSERLLDYRQQYEWAVVMDFNKDQVRGRGTGTTGLTEAQRAALKALGAVEDMAEL